MSSPEGDTPGTSTETGTGFSETQLKTLAGMMEQCLTRPSRAGAKSRSKAPEGARPRGRQTPTRRRLVSRGWKGREHGGSGSRPTRAHRGRRARAQGARDKGWGPGRNQLARRAAAAGRGGAAQREEGPSSMEGVVNRPAGMGRRGQRRGPGSWGAANTSALAKRRGMAQGLV